MARRRVVSKRKIKLEAKYQNPVVTSFINHIMQNGKKSVAQKTIYKALDKLVELTRKRASDAIELLTSALDKVKPPVEVQSRRVGGATYQVPVEVSPGRALKLAMTWVVAGSKKQHGSSAAEKIAKELRDALNDTGSAVKTKIDRIKMAEANRAFASYSKF